MQKTRSKQSRDTVPLIACIFLLCCPPTGITFHLLWEYIINAAIVCSTAAAIRSDRENTYSGYPYMEIYERKNWWKNQIQSFTCLLFWNYLQILKSSPITRVPASKILTLKILTERACDSLKSYRKPPVTSYFLRIFPAANERSALKAIDHREDFQKAFSKLVSNFKEAIKS